VNRDRALLILSRARLPDVVLRTLLSAYPDPETALAAACHGAGARLPAETLALLRRPDVARLDADQRWLDGADRHLLAWGDADYPPLLRQAPSPPGLLFVAGDPDLLWFPQIAIVGSRRPSAGGAERARRFAADFAAAGWVVTSGLAEGIDAAAHAGALAHGRTVAVVGTGLQHSYPAKNAALQARIAAAGTVVSEHPPDTGARPSHFPSRNRIIAGLALGTLVVEAAIQSGALITGRLAAEAGREVFALPGSPDNPLARGCHRLIRQGAALVEEPEEVVAGLAEVAATLAESLRGRLLAPVAGSKPDSAAAQPDDPDDHSRLWSALGHDPSGLDALTARTGLTVAELSSILLVMELDGRIVVDNGRYARRS
jgi:DNA processing protein